jgi:hypothetical protein
MMCGQGVRGADCMAIEIPGSHGERIKLAA